MHMKRRKHASTKCHTQQERGVGTGGRWGVQAARRMKLTKQTDTDAYNKISKHMAGLHLWTGIQVGLQSRHWGPRRLCPCPTDTERDTGLEGIALEWLTMELSAACLGCTRSSFTYYFCDHGMSLYLPGLQFPHL